MVPEGEERAPAVRARGRVVVAVETGVGARAVDFSGCPGLAGILFWSRGRVGSASGGGAWVRGKQSRAARALGKGGEGAGARKGGLSPLIPLGTLDWDGIRGGNDRDGGGEGAVSGAGPAAAAQR